MMGQREDGEREPAGWRGGEGGGGRGDARGKRRWRITAGLAGAAAALPVRGRGQRVPPGSAPALTWGLQLRILCPLRIFLPAPPGDFSAPESRSPGQVPPAASSPRGTPGATPLTAHHWLEFTPVTFPLAEGEPSMQIRTDPPPHRLAGAGGAEPLDLRSDWPMTVTRGGFSARARGSSRGGSGPGVLWPVLGPRGPRLRPAPAGGGASASVVDSSSRAWASSLQGGRGRGGPVS